MAIWTGRELAFFMAGGSCVSLAWLVSTALDSVQVRRWRDGARGERFTAAALRHLHGDGWRCVDDVPLDGWNVDHVAAGPGGIYAVETKWTNEPWDLVTGRFKNRHAQNATRQAQRGAQRIASMLKANYDLVADVQPLLVIWGPGQPNLDRPTLVDGVRVVTGSHLTTALKNTACVVDNERRDEIINAIDHMVSLHEEWEHVRSHRPRLVDVSSRRAS